MKDDKLMEIVMARVAELESTANEQTKTIKRQAAEIDELEKGRDGWKDLYRGMVRERDAADARRRRFVECAGILVKERDALKSSLADITAQFEALRNAIGVVQIPPKKNGEKPTRTALRIATEAVNELRALGFDATISYQKRDE